MVDDTVERYFTEEHATAFATLYFAQLTARQRALEFWYAADAQLTVRNTPYVGAAAIFEQLIGFPRAGYDIDAVDVRADTDVSALLRVTGNLMLDGAFGVRPFEASFTLNRSSVNDAYVIAGQTLRGI